MIGFVAFAFGAGMVATVNPCGFAMLPAYISMFLSGGSEGSGNRASLRIGTVVTLAFVATFSVVGAVFSLIATSIVRYVPYAALVVGVLLLAAGVAMLAGRRLPIRTLQLRFDRDASNRSVAMFGIAYAVASVSCTLPIFLSVTTAASLAGSVTGGVTVFAAYGLGMGAVLIALAVAVATSRDAVVRAMRRVMPHVERIGAWLLVLSGLFITYYWTVLLTVDVTSGGSVLAPILFVDRISSWFANQLANRTLAWAIVLIAIVVAVIGFEVHRAGRRKREVTS